MPRPMSRTPFLLALPGLLAAAAVAVPAVAAPAPAAPPASVAAGGPAPELGARLADCATGPAAEDRRAVFTAGMPRSDGASVLAMRFELQRRDARGDWRRLAAPTFGGWERSRPGVAGFVYTKRVAGLPAPGAYRVSVRFRWLDADGHVVRRAVRRSRACVQPDPRPDLEVQELEVLAGPDGPVLEVLVRNAGRGATLAPAVVAATAGETALPARSVPPLGPGALVPVRLELPPACAPGTPLRVTLDPADGIDEADERDNVAATTCP